MARTTGTYKTTAHSGERVRAFLPYPLPPRRPALRIDGDLERQHRASLAAVGRLEVSGSMVPSPNWFLYGFVRKEAVVSSQIEGTQATLEDLVACEANPGAQPLPDVEEVCNYVAALSYARAELAKPNGLPLCTHLLCEVHKRLMAGAGGSDKQPGTVRTTQNWIGGTRPVNARFVPPPPEALPDALGALELWIHSNDPLPPLVKAGLAHAQFETIHPFLDGNGRIGRLLVTLLLEHWNVLSSPLLYLSLGFKRHRQEYYRRLDGVRIQGDWEGWTRFYLQCVAESADDAVATAQRLFALVASDRRSAALHKNATVASLRLFEYLPEHPMITLAKATELVGVTKPTASKAIDALRAAGILTETTGKKRDRIYAYRRYLDVLAEETEAIVD